MTYDRLLRRFTKPCGVFQILTTSYPDRCSLHQRIDLIQFVLLYLSIFYRYSLCSTVSVNCLNNHYTKLILGAPNFIGTCVISNLDLCYFVSFNQCLNLLFLPQCTYIVFCSYIFTNTVFHLIVSFSIGYLLISLFHRFCYTLCKREK